MHSDVSLQRLFDTMPNGLIMVGEGGRIRLINSQVERMFGYSAAELDGMAIETLIPQRYHHRHVGYRDAFLQKMERRPMGAGRDLFALRKDGSEFPVEVALTPVEDGHGGMVLCTVVDISERKKVEAQKDQFMRELDIRNSEITALYQISELLRGNVDSDALMVEVCDAVSLGLSRGPIAGVRISLDGRAHESREFAEGVHRQSTPVRVQGRHRGEIEAHYLEQPVVEYSHLLADSAVQFLRRVADMIGESVERLEAQAKVLHSSKLASVGELAAGIGHEINNPINGIINCAEILLKDVAADSKQEKFLELIRKEAERVAKIVASLLAFSRQDKYHYSAARLHDVINGVLDLCRKRIAKSHIHMKVELPDDLPKIMCRSEQLQQVVMNLVINAVHALDDKYPEAHENKRLLLEARQVVVDGEPCVSLCIEDRGAGIAPENRERIFDPFFTTKGRDKGTGLGLSVSDGIVKSHGGSISLESEMGEFTRFVITLPVGRTGEPAP